MSQTARRNLETSARGDAVTSVEAPAAVVSQTKARGRWRGAAAPLLVFVLFLGFSAGILVHAWRAPLTHIVGSQDALQTMWFMTWVPYALTHHHGLFVSTYMNYPAGVSLSWNVSVIGPAVLVWPVTTIWNAVLSYNVIMTVSPALAGVFAFMAIRRYVPRTLPALAGAALYGFSPYMLGHLLGHMHVVASAVTAPLVLLLADELFVRQRLRFWLLGVLMALVAVFQFFTHEENFVSEVMAAALLTLCLAIVFRRQLRAKWPYVRRVLIVAVPLTALVLAYPIYMQLYGTDRVLTTLHDPDMFATDLLNPVVPDYLQLIAPSAAQALSNQFTGNAAEWNAYLGIPLLVITIVTVVRCWRVPLVRVAGVMAGVMTLLSFGPHLHVAGHVTPIPLPWWIAAHIPLIGDVTPARLTEYAYLAVAVVLAFALARLLTLRAGAALAAAGAAVALIPLIPGAPQPATTVSAPAFFTSSYAEAIPQGAVVLAIPWASPDSFAHLDALTWAVETHMRFRLIGGYFLNPPSPGQDQLHAFVDSLASAQPPAQLTAGEAAEVLSQLQRNQVGAVLLDDVPQRAASRRLLTELFGSAPRDVGGADLWLLPTPPPAG